MVNISRAPGGAFERSSRNLLFQFDLSRASIAKALAPPPVAGS
jgi:hypothetical protein